MHFILYNACMLAKPFRLARILELLTADVVLLTGLGCRLPSTAAMPYQTMHVSGYYGLVWGWRRAAMKKLIKMRWDFTKLAACLQSGVGRIAYLEELEREFVR